MKYQKNTLFQEFYNEKAGIRFTITGVGEINAAAAKGKEVPQIVLQGNWVEQWGFCIGSAVRVKYYPNKLVILEEENS